MKAGLEQIGGQDFFVRRWGDPALPRLLLLHGFPEFGGAWEDLAPRLAHRFHVIAPDQRGYGQSWVAPEVKDYRLFHLVSDMAELIGPQPAYVMGHDWGASVAYGLAMAHPDLVTKLVIANGVHPVPFQRALVAGGAQTDASQYITALRKPTSHAHLAADNFAKLMQAFSAGMDLSWLTPARAKLYQTEWARPGRLEAMIHWYRASPLIVPPAGTSAPMPDMPLDRLRVPMPHLLIWGEKDTALLPEATQDLEAFAPDLTRINIPDADHWLIHQKPDEIAQIILDWI